MHVNGSVDYGVLKLLMWFALQLVVRSLVDQFVYTKNIFEGTLHNCLHPCPNPPAILPNPLLKRSGFNF